MAITHSADIDRGPGFGEEADNALEAAAKKREGHELAEEQPTIQVPNPTQPVAKDPKGEYAALVERQTDAHWDRRACALGLDPESTRAVADIVSTVSAMNSCSIGNGALFALNPLATGSAAHELTLHA